MVETDLLARVCAEIEQRMTELRPLLDEYERLLEAADTLASIETAASDGPPAAVPAPPATTRRRGARDRSKIGQPKIGQRGSAAGAIELASSAPEPVIQAPEPTPAVPREPRILPGMPSLRTQPGPGGLSSLSMTPAHSAPAPIQTPPTLPEPAIPEPTIEELEPEPEVERKPASPSEVQLAIVAALEHGSHTISELVMVTAMSTTEIRTNLSQLTRQRKVARVKRQGDGKSAFALPASSSST
jgi:hypothetical protein